MISEVSLEDGATMYRSSFLRLMRDMGAFIRANGDVSAALQAFDASSEVRSQSRHSKRKPGFPH